MDTEIISIEYCLKGLLIDAKNVIGSDKPFLEVSTDLYNGLTLARQQP